MKIIVFHIQHQVIGPVKDVEETIKELNELLELRSQNENELHVEKFKTMRHLNNSKH